jgi:hypothetical protein
MERPPTSSSTTVPPASEASSGSHHTPPPAEFAMAPIEEMLNKLAAYVAGEAEMSIEDYRLLESMNLAAAARYREMAEYSSGLVAFAERLQSKTNDIQPQLAQIDVLEAQVGELECAVEQLDAYTLRLERKFVELVS